eukprot:jgi/Chlat1/2004/Chrsp158S02290
MAAAAAVLSLPSCALLPVAIGRKPVGAKRRGTSDLLARLPVASRSGVAWRAAPGRTNNRRVSTVCGLPVPIIGPFFNPFTAFLLYSVGVVRFLGGFEKTSFSGSTQNKLGLAAAWPVLFAVSPSFRANFKKAILRT